MMITCKDYQEVIHRIRFISNRYSTNFRCIQNLKKKILSTKIVHPGVIPPDIITMNSIVNLKNIKNGIEFNVELVYPEYQDIKNHKISIFSMLGAAIFLKRIGDEVTYKTWKSNNIVKILDIPFQPESKGYKK